MQDAYEFYLTGINNALGHTPYLANNSLSLADIAFLCDFTQFQRELYFTPKLRAQGLEPISAALAQDLHPEFAAQPNPDFPRVPDYIETMLSLTEIGKDLVPYIEDLKSRLKKVFASQN